MDQLAKTELFGLLSESSQTVTNHEMQHAYENFVTEVVALNQSETDYQTAFRSLNFSRVELQSLQTQLLHGQGEKCLKKSVLSESYCYH